MSDDTKRDKGTEDDKKVIQFPAPSRAVRKRHLKPDRETKFRKLRALKCFPEADKKVREGISTIEIAGWIQQQGEGLDISRESISSQLRQYRATIPPAELLAPKRSIPAVSNALVALEKGVDEVDELSKLYRLQEQRIEIGYNLERKTGFLMPTTGNEVRVAKDILKDSAGIKMDLGINTRHLGQLDIEANLTAQVGRYGNESVAKVVASPDARRKVLSVFEKFTALAQRGVPFSLEEHQDAASIIDAEVREVVETPAEDDKK